jgi:drug/metabolite transporter (DMT)-like permease
MVLFALGFPAADVLLASWGIVALSAVRIVLAVGLLVPIWILMDGFARVRRAPWLRGMVIGGIGFGTGSLSLLITQSMTDAVTAALAAAMMPIAAVILEVVFDGRRLTAAFLFGVVFVLLGGIVAAGGSLMESRFGLGALIGIGATFLFAWASRASVKSLPDMSSMGQATLTLVGAMLFNLGIFGVFAAMGWAGTHVGNLDGYALSMLAIYAFCGMAISQVFWILGVSKIGVGMASFHLNATPFYVMLVVVAMGGRWDWTQALGAAILAVGVVLAQRGGAWRTVSSAA